MYGGGFALVFIDFLDFIDFLSIFVVYVWGDCVEILLLLCRDLGCERSTVVQETFFAADSLPPTHDSTEIHARISPLIVGTEF